MYHLSLCVMFNFALCTLPSHPIHCRPLVFQLYFSNIIKYGHGSIIHGQNLNEEMVYKRERNWLIFYFFFFSLLNHKQNDRSMLLWTFHKTYYHYCAYLLFLLNKASYFIEIQTYTTTND